MPVYTDMLGRKVNVPQFPRRIVSLVPSQTEYLFDIGLDDEVVGLTKFCIHPEWAFRSKTKVGGTKNIQIETVRALSPDLIIANKEENVKEQIEALSKIAPVWTSAIQNMGDAFTMMRSLATICGKEAQARPIIEKIVRDFSLLPLPQLKGKRVAYAIWQKPWMFVGAQNFIHDLLERLGFVNVFSQQNRYPEATLEDLAAAQPDYLLLSSEPYPFSQEHVAQMQALLPLSKVLLADGEMFSWYGSRLAQSVPYFGRLFA